MSGLKITNQVKRLRFLNGELTQAQLADKIGVTRQTIHAIETGKYQPSLEVAFKLSNAFGVTIEDVFEVTGETV
ncbi:MAG: helix-turn-helix transcriptional regulator [Verrucomicrobiota bacterium]